MIVSCKRAEEKQLCDFNTLRSKRIKPTHLAWRTHFHFHFAWESVWFFWYICLVFVHLFWPFSVQ